jgi:hypothetical protein
MSDRFRNNASRAGDGHHRIACVAVAALLVCATGRGAAAQRLPAVLEALLSTEAHLSPAEHRNLLSGAAVATLLGGVDQSKEVAVFGAVWINASPSAYVRHVKDIENFERGGAFRVTKRISDPPRLADFAAMHLPEDDIKDLRTCRIGDCELKLGAAALRQFRTEVPWNTPAAAEVASRVFREQAYEYVTGYREGGNARLAVYRDADRPTFVASEFRSMIERLPGLLARPDLRHYLLAYPKASLARSTDFFYWQDVQFGLKPTIRINHLIIQDRDDATVIVSKMLYATHYFWTALETRLLIPDASRGAGFWFVTVNRSRSDGLSGFVGRLIRGRVRNEARQGTLAGLTATKTKLETVAR